MTTPVDKIKRRKVRKNVTYSRYGYYFITPFIIVYCIFGLFPTINTLNLAFTDLAGWATEYNYVGFRNFDLLLKKAVNHDLIECFTGDILSSQRCDC